MENNYIKIYDFMLNLGLTSSQLIIYALIYGIEKSTGKPFEGSHNYIAKWTSETERSVRYNLQKMIAKGLITKNKSGNFCKYGISNKLNETEKSSEQVGKNFLPETEKSSEQVGKNFLPETEKSSEQVGKNFRQYNRDIIDIYNRDIIVANDSNIIDERLPRSVWFPTVLEIEEFCKTQNLLSDISDNKPQKFLDYLNDIKDTSINEQSWKFKYVHWRMQFIMRI